MELTVLFEKRDSFWENLIQKFQGFSHVAIAMNGKKYETHPNHGVLVNRYIEDSYKNTVKFVIQVSDETVKHIERSAEMFQKQGYNRLSLLFILIQILTGVWVGGRPNKFNCASWVAYCLWPEKQWYKFDIKKVYENIIGNSSSV